MGVKTVGLLLVFLIAFGNASLNPSLDIALFPGGVISEEKIKSNLINAYHRFLRNRSFVLIVDGVPRINSKTDWNIVEKINSLDLKRERKSCVHWNMDLLINNAYIITDLNPCNPYETIKKAQAFIKAGHEITTIGMGNAIELEWLEKTCGPCGSFGCIKGWNFISV